MLIGRFVVIIPALALAGHLSGKNISLAGRGTFATDGALFILLVVAVVLLVGALSHFPVLLLGPLAEHFLMLNGRAF